VARPRRRRPRGAGGPSKLDIAIAVATAALVVLGTIPAARLQDQVRSLDAGAIALITLAAVALAWRRRAPVALLVFEERPDQARESLEAIRSTSVKALDDLRTTLDEFHPRAGEGLRDLDALVDSVRAAGLPVRLRLQEVAVPDDLGHVAYRVVQEALTNTLRHAGPTTAEVHVRRDQGTLVVDVLDGGVGAQDVRPGRGLTGMRNRVVAAGGDLVAEPRTGRGFQVRAIRVVAAGEALLSPSVTKRLITRFSQRPASVFAPVPGLEELTERERELVGWVATGRSNEEIGQELSISPATVRTHVGRAMIKLHAGTARNQDDHPRWRVERELDSGRPQDPDPQGTRHKARDRRRLWPRQPSPCIHRRSFPQSRHNARRTMATKSSA
jgi:DNA-binding CsgD family transcriptional regulator